MLPTNAQADKVCRVLFLLGISSLIVIIAVFYIDVHYNMFVEKQTYTVCLNVALQLMPELITVILLLVCLSLLYNVLYQNKRHKLERDMLRLEKLATVNQLAAGIAHEIRNPLTSIKGFIQLILKKGEQPAPREYLEVALSEIERIERLTSEFQVLARPVKPPVFKTTDLANTIRDVLILMKSQAEGKNINIGFQYQTGFVVNGDASQLKQVWINLVRNALEAVDEHGTINILMEMRSNVIEIKIYNSGAGIPEHLLNKLGTPFFTTKESGTGLGLSVCYSIINGHGGRIKVASSQAGGTTFTVVLPYAGDSL